jgi:hypothetical protein
MKCQQVKQEWLYYTTKTKMVETINTSIQLKDTLSFETFDSHPYVNDTRILLLVAWTGSRAADHVPVIFNVR